MNDTPNIFTSNSRFLPPPVRTVNQHPSSYRRGDCQRAAAFLNQDWTPTPTPGTSLNLPAEVPLSPSAEQPPPRSDCSHSEDDSDDDYDPRFDATSRVKRERFSPESPFNYPQRPPQVRPDRRASLSTNDLQPLTGRRHSSGTDSILVSRSLGSGSPSHDRGARPGPYSPYHHQTKSWPVALHPSSSSHSQPSPPGPCHRRNLSNNSYSTGSPPQTPPTPSSPALSTKNESVQSSSTASPPAAVNTDEHIQRISGGKSKCIWNDASGNECGFQSSSSLVKRHVRTVHLKIRCAALCPSAVDSTYPLILPAPLSALSVVKVSRPSSISKLIKIFSEPAFLLSNDPSTDNETRTALAKNPTHVLIAPRPSPTLPADTTIESDTTAMCSPGGITVIRTKRTNSFAYLLDSRRMDLLHFPGQWLAYFIRPQSLITICPTRYHSTYILSELTSQKAYSFRIPSLTMPASSSLSPSLPSQQHFRILHFSPWVLRGSTRTDIRTL